jgi:hypothetical protein
MPAAEQLLAHQARLSPFFGMLRLFGAYGTVELSGYFATEQVLLPYDQSDPRLGPTVKFDAAWMDRAELVIVRTTRWAPVERTLRIDNFRVGEQ